MERMINVGIFMLNIPENSTDLRDRLWRYSNTDNDSLSHQNEAITYITIQQFSVRFSWKGKQNNTRYVNKSARLTIRSLK